MATPTPIERYVALGDSYTIGEGVEEGERWPNLLTTHLREAGIDIELVANPSRTGWTTERLIERELPVFDESQPTFATLLIGVNDWVRAVTPVEFEANLITILDHVQAGLPDPGRLVVVTIPDFSVTPSGGDYSYGRDITGGLAGFNVITATHTARRDVPLVDIFPLSRETVGPEWVAADGLHPSAAAYVEWERLILPAALSVLR
ncbi:MAG TPA: SGNH/GDSL hydrolase family protein [Thermomicrobiales bacterium]|jgi:lysophospholipase L1-like esterase|nr:SGNH/GDSL hydrolase family protein [Thermomicrobiales bacterium]